MLSSMNKICSFIINSAVELTYNCIKELTATKKINVTKKLIARQL